MTEELKYTDWAKDLPLKGSQSRFAPKLTFEDRCAWFAIYHGNARTVSVSDIAEAAGISTPVAHALLSLHHGRYRNVKDEYKRLGGVVGMTQKYVENHHIERIQVVKHSRSGLVPKPGQISLGGREFEIKQEENKWVAYDLAWDIVAAFTDTYEQAVDECIAFAKQAGPYVRG